MSIEGEDIVLVPQPEESTERTTKQFKISYTREFLLSLCDLEACKKLPSGFDESILSEFQGLSASYGIQDRPRVPGSSSLQGFRRSDYGSSPPTRDVGNFSRETHRWDTRSSGRGDTDSQSDKDSDSGRRYGNQSRRSWQTSEHDGLLGSGSFPRPSGYGAGVPIAKPRPSDHDQLNKVNEPYQPPRPYKATPHTRRDKDSFNDETFGSTEVTSQDRAEEERKRRAEFELMRKEQQKVLQENLKSCSGKPKVDLFSPLMDELGGGKTTEEVIDRPVKPSVQHDSGKLSGSSAPPFRPLVPPGFASSAAEKNSLAQPLNPSNPVEVGKFEPEFGHESEKESARGMSVVKLQSSVASLPSHWSGRDVIGEFSSAASKVVGNDEMVQFDSERTSVLKIAEESSQSTSILEKLFGSALSKDGATAAKLVEDQDAKTHDISSPRDFGSSKFAQWFLDGGKQPIDNVSQEKSNGLLSLIVGDKGGTMISDGKATLDPILEFHLARVASDISSSPVEPIGFSEDHYKKKIEVTPAVLTCEDLEQSILSGINENNSDSQPVGQVYYASDLEADQSKAGVDNSASEHLLSLLQMGSGSKAIASNSILERRSLDHQDKVEPRSVDVIHGNVNGGSDLRNNSGKTLTLETLFGTAFMQELQSVGAPVSSQNNSDGSAKADASLTLPSPTSDDVRYTHGVEEIGQKHPGTSNSVPVNRPENMNPDLKGHYFGFDDTRSGPGLLQQGSDASVYDGPLEARLPEEDSLIAVSDPAQGSMFASAPDVSNPVLFSSNQPLNIADKLAALAFKDEQSVVGGQGGLPFLGGPFDMVKPEVAYENFHAQSPPMHFHPQQMNHMRPSFHPLERRPAQIDPQMNYLTPEMVIRHDVRPHHQFPPNVVPPPYQNPGLALPEFDRSIHHPLLQQMHMPGNLRHAPHAFGGFPRGGPVPLHPSNSPAGYPQEQNPMQGFPFAQQSDFNRLGLPQTGPEFGGMSNPPEALQRLLEMELRSNQKPVVRPFPPSSRPRPIHGAELDPSFWYR